MLTSYLRFMSEIFQYTLRTSSVVQLLGNKNKSKENTIFF